MQTESQLEIRKQNLPANIKDLSQFILVGREKLKVYRAKLKVIDELCVAQAVRQQTVKDGQEVGEALLWAEVKLGELLREIPKKGDTLTSTGGRKVSLPSGVSHKQSFFAQNLARNKDLIKEVVEEAVENEDIPTRTEVLRKSKDREKEVRIKKERSSRTNEISDIEVRKGDFKDVLNDLNNIDAIITDPPYPKEFIQCFSDLSKYSSEHLKEDGFLAVYSGQYNLPEVIERLSEHLTYVWTFCLYHEGKKQLVNGVNIMCGWKPVLIFSKGKKKMRFSAYDVLHSEAREKHSHEWQQSESGVEPLIEIFSKPGDLIVDPFAGSGTFLKVAKHLGRRAIGAEIDSSRNK